MVLLRPSRPRCRGRPYQRNTGAGTSDARIAPLSPRSPWAKSTAPRPRAVVSQHHASLSLAASPTARRELTTAPGVCPRRLALGPQRQHGQSTSLNPCPTRVLPAKLVHQAVVALRRRSPIAHQARHGRTRRRSWCISQAAHARSWLSASKRQMGEHGVKYLGDIRQMIQQHRRRRRHRAIQIRLSSSTRSS